MLPARRSIITRHNACPPPHLGFALTASVSATASTASCLFVPGALRRRVHCFTASACPAAAAGSRPRRRRLFAGGRSGANGRTRARLTMQSVRHKQCQVCATNGTAVRENGPGHLSPRSCCRWGPRPSFLSPRCCSPPAPATRCVRPKIHEPTVVMCGTAYGSRLNGAPSGGSG